MSDYHSAKQSLRRSYQLFLVYTPISLLIAVISIYLASELNVGFIAIAALGFPIAVLFSIISGSVAVSKANKVKCTNCGEPMLKFAGAIAYMKESCRYCGNIPAP